MANNRARGRVRLRAGIVAASLLGLAAAGSPAASGAEGDREGGSLDGVTVQVDDVTVPVLATFSGRATNHSEYHLVRGAIHGVQRVGGATVLYASVGFPEGTGPSRFSSAHFFRDFGGKGYPLTAMPTMALVDRPGLKSYWPLMAGRETLFTTRGTDVNYPSGELGVVWGVFPELPEFVTEIDVVFGHIQVTVPLVPVGQGLLEPVVDDPVPLLGTGWPRVPDADVIAQADPLHTTFDLLRRTESAGGEAATSESNEEVVTTLDANVLFDTSSAELTPAALDVLARVAEDIAARGVGEVVVTGHTDSDGSTASNQVLSEGRAASVVSALQPAVGSRVTLVAVGRGEAEPVAPNDTPENKQLNRRVTIEYRIAGGDS